jgi:hypothetical protein
MCRAARSLEAVESYGKAAIPLIKGRRLFRAPVKKRFSADEAFWQFMLKARGRWGVTVRLENFALSEWVARVPGLYYSEGAWAMRSLADEAVEYESAGWRVLTPLGKSREVIGGKGSLRLPRDEGGYRLVSLSSVLSASSGVPVLISPTVWDHHRLREGSYILSVEGTWHSMSCSGWADRFPSVRGIPKGYLIVDKPEKMVPDAGRRVPTQFHPFTVMEYHKGDARLYDFVYATADTAVPRYRSKLVKFFEGYKKAKGRFGRYLLAADITDPLWEADYERPEDLTRAQPSARSHLELLQARVRSNSFKGKNLDAIVQMLAGTYDGAGLRRISRKIQIPTSHWHTERAVADSAADLLAVCVERGKVEELLDVVAAEYPHHFA